MVLDWAERLECRKFVTPQDIVDVSFLFFSNFFCQQVINPSSFFYRVIQNLI